MHYAVPCRVLLWVVQYIDLRIYQCCFYAAVKYILHFTQVLNVILLTTGLHARPAAALLVAVA